MSTQRRHPLPDTRWPDRDQAAVSRLFSPMRLESGLELTGRSWVPAMVPWRASDEGFVTPAVLDWYGRFAEGRPAVLVVEATGIRDVPSGPLLRIGHDRFLPGLAELVGRVREASEGSTRLLIQVIDFLRIRRRPDPGRFLGEFLTLTDRHREALRPHLEGADRQDDRALREVLVGLGEEALTGVLSARELEALRMGERERISDLHLPHVEELPRVLPGLFAGAASRAQAVGFDGVELHFAHAYTMASFLSRRNTRTDGYGGSLEGRLRLPLEVVAAVRSQVGVGYTLGCRFLSEEVIEGGSTVDEACRIGVALADAGLDFLSLSRGGKFEDAKQPRIGEAAYPYTGESGHACMPTVFGARAPFGLNLPLSAQVRRAVREAGFTTPIVAAGGIATFELAEQALAEGQADLIAAARQSLADPDWFLKLREGRGDEIQRCLFTNYCEALDQRHKQVTCQLWDRLAASAGEALSTDGKRRLVAPRGDWRTKRSSPP
jgi:2,4-dienoyl-CoA reductase-like NADH-dependent reductase (Old Yellow Enzyme family)